MSVSLPEPKLSLPGPGVRGWLPARSAVELLGLALVVPIFWFPFRVPWLTLLALLVLPASWLLRWRACGRFTIGSSLEAPLVYVLLATCVAAMPVFDPQLAAPKILGMALGATMLVALENAVDSRLALDRSRVVLAALLLVLSGVAFVGAEWTTGKLAPLDALHERLPVLIRGVVPNTTQGGINPNELAGVLILLLPTVLAQIVARPVSQGAWQTWLGVVAGLVGLVALLAMQSRGALVGMLTALCFPGVVWLLGALWRAHLSMAARAALAAAALCVAGVGAGLAWRLVLARLTMTGEPLTIESLPGRLELWLRALTMLRDFALTGIGIGQFNPVLHILYAPSFQLPGEQFVPHPHNLYLDYAVELGVPGVVAFGLLVLGFGRECARAIRSTDPLLCWTGLGLAGGIIAFLVFGLSDAIAPGARGGLALWIVLGLGAAIGTLARAANATNRPDGPRQTRLDVLH